MRSVGGTNVRIEHGGRHPRVVFDWNGRERYKAISCTPGDWHAINAAIRELREMLGLNEHKRKVGARRRRKSIASDLPAEPPTTLTEIPDWRADLLAKLSPAEREHLLRLAFVAFWRDCMAQVGGRSVL